MNIEAGIAISIETEVKTVRQFAETEQLGKERERDLTAVSVAGKNQADSVARGERKESGIVSE
jgi:hypothetical protein